MADSLKYYPSFLAGERTTSPNSTFLRITEDTYSPSSWARGSAGGSTGQGKGNYYFLCPPTLTFGVNHQWEDFTETIASKIRDVNVGWQMATKQLGEGVALMSDVIGGMVKANSWGSLSVKNDSPLIYKNSDRVSYQFNFEFYDPVDPFNNVWLPIQTLINASCPVSGGGGNFASVGFGFPKVFKIATVTGENPSTPTGLIDNTCAVTSVLPTYEAPYINGYPQKASVDVTFMSIYQTYSSSFSKTYGKLANVETEEGYMGGVEITSTERVG